jgi:hypothetical protein
MWITYELYFKYQKSQSSQVNINRVISIILERFTRKNAGKRYKLINFAPKIMNVDK